MTQILMPKATAVWLIDNTAMTFQQISEFCDLHILEVEGIADGDVAAGIRGADPIANGQVSREEIEKAEGDANYAMKPNSFDSDKLEPKTKKKGPRYTPLSRRQDRPRTHWKINTINPTDPVSLGLCSQIDLDSFVKKAAEKKAKEQAKLEAEGGGQSLEPLEAPAPVEDDKPKVEHTLESLFKPSS